MLGDLDLIRLKKALAGLPEPLELVFHPTSGRSALSEEMEAAALQIEQASGGAVRLRRAPPAERQHLPERPALSLGWRGKSNIHYLAIPEGPEVLPFIEALQALPAGVAGHQEPWTRKLSGLRRPARLFVFMATTCPNCPRTVRAALQLSLVSHGVHSYIIDVQRYPRLGERYRIKSVPATVLDDGWTGVGMMSPAELVERILRRDDPDMDQEVFDSLVESGRLDDAADWLLDHGASAFAVAWQRATLSVRVALMLLAEKVLEKDRRALEGCVETLLESLDSDDAAQRGDTADLLGRLGDARALEPLRRLGDDPNPDVAEIARDAVDQLLHE